MKLLEVAGATLSPDIEKKSNKIFSAVKKETARYGKAKFEMKALEPLKVQIIVEMQKFMHPEDINDAYSEITRAIVKADVNGHIQKQEETGSGANFVEALLTGLRPGMKPIMVEAFFPTLMFDITWKNIVSKGKR